MTEAFGFEHFWTQADGLIRADVYLLVAMSLASWFLIFFKTWSAYRARRAISTLDGFWASGSLSQALATLRSGDPDALLTGWATEAAAVATDGGHRSGPSGWSGPSERLTRVLRDGIGRATARLEGGLTMLASVGATAPFVGLLGTVWGIYHALLNIASSGSLSIDKVAGPVGEALIMTAMGLGVAIPAVLAYNGFARANRRLSSQIDGFAHDLNAALTKGLVRE
jgi:biopolymer transport protein ExbB